MTMAYLSCTRCTADRNGRVISRRHGHVASRSGAPFRILGQVRKWSYSSPTARDAPDCTPLPRNFHVTGFLPGDPGPAGAWLWLTGRRLLLHIPCGCAAWRRTPHHHPDAAGMLCRSGGASLASVLCPACGWRFIPRSRGEHRPGALSGFPGRGSSPLARGTPRLRRGTSGPVRFIPARAGNTGSEKSSPTPPTVHPRSRGEHSMGDTGRWPVFGSSPLARGTQPAGTERAPSSLSSPSLRFLASCPRGKRPGPITRRGARRRSGSAAPDPGRGSRPSRARGSGRSR